MDPAQIAKLDQAGAGLRDIAEIVGAMAKIFTDLGVKPNAAVGHAINLCAQLFYAVATEPDDE